MLQTLGLLLTSIVRCFRTRRSLLLENLVLRQQLAILKRRHPRPRLGRLDKLFWVLIHRCWSCWKQALVVVTPETVVRWHRAGFRLYWRFISKVKKPIGRRHISKEFRQLVLQVMAWTFPNCCIPEDELRADFFRQSFAEWRGPTLDR